ncbi:putative transcription factor PosF21 [Platanthera guangdongensis]|uniref:Transcription factor PosF21 n=1 Tax=Platanthera guangdongensis TaxID=2320717 RepID=A0ABR2LM90_9ASPA
MPQLLEEPKSSSAPKQSMYGSFVQLPPKIPSNWPPTPNHHRHLPGHPSTASFSPPSSATLPSEPSWPHEFLGHPTPNRPAHRRAASDSSADSTFPEFDRRRHDNLMYMLSDDARHSSSAETSAAPCTPSDHDSITGDKPDPSPSDPLAWSEHDQSEAQSSCNAEQRAAPPAAAATYNTDSQPIVDPKRVKRILANRKSAQRSRVRKLQYITELERSLAKLQMQVSALSPRVAFLDHQRSILTVGNSQLRQRIVALAQDNIFRDTHQETLKKEIESLRRAHRQHIIKKMDETARPDDY